MNDGWAQNMKVHATLCAQPLQQQQRRCVPISHVQKITAQKQMPPAPLRTVPLVASGMEFAMDSLLVVNVPLGTLRNH